MRCLVSAKRMSASLAVVAVFVGVSRAPADGRPRYYPARAVPFRQPAPHYAPRYFGPTTTYGSTSYLLANRPPFYSPPYVGYGYAPYGAYGYGSVAGYGYPPPYYGGPYAAYRVPNPLYYEPYTNPVLQETMLENQLRWGPNLAPSITPLRARVRLRPSTPEQKAKSIHAQAQGDVWMRRLKFLNAYERYKFAISIANDRPEAYFRTGYALAAVGSFDSAVKYIKQGLDLDPQWPSHGERLEAIFGDDNRLAILTLTERVTGWVREDIRDPDRLFLVGVLLHFNGDSRASQFFEAAYRLAGSGDHLLAFLQPAPEIKDGTPASSQPGQPTGQSNTGLFNGAAPPPAPMEPPLPLDAIPGAALNPNGPNARGPALTPRPIGPNPPPQNNPVPFFQRPNRPLPTPAAPQGLVPQSPVPQSPPPSVAPPAGVAPQRPATPVPALPLPPLPAPIESGPGPQSNSQPPTGGPVLISPSGGSTTAQSP
jgi:hypothetical protein